MNWKLVVLLKWFWDILNGKWNTHGICDVMHTKMIRYTDTKQSLHIFVIYFIFHYCQTLFEDIFFIAHDIPHFIFSKSEFFKQYNQFSVILVKKPLFQLDILHTTLCLIKDLWHLETCNDVTPSRNICLLLLIK